MDTQGERMDQDHAGVDGPWLVLDYERNPTIRVDARVLERVLAHDDCIVLAINGVTPFIRIPGGAVGAQDIAARLAPFTRTFQGDGLKAACVFVGDVPVLVTKQVLYVGSFACRVSDVEDYASLGADIPLPNGILPAGVAMVAVAVKR